MIRQKSNNEWIVIFLDYAVGTVKTFDPLQKMGTNITDIGLVSDLNVSVHLLYATRL